MVLHNTRTDELMVAAAIHDHGHRLRSYEILAEVGRSLGLSELRIDHGPCYRVYFMRHGQRVYVILGGDTKWTQSTDIEAAHRIAADIRQSVDDTGTGSGKRKT